jgi:hypothetical protein
VAQIVGGWAPIEVRALRAVPNHPHAGKVCIFYKWTAYGSSQVAALARFPLIAQFYPLEVVPDAFTNLCKDQ